MTSSINSITIETLHSEVVKTLPRLLTQLDRDNLSPTFGCFDRNYWHYKIRDFSSIVLQQNVYALALLYHNRFAGNFLYKLPETYQCIIGTLDFWSKSQHKNGSFDEYWPNEQGYPPLVFSTHAVLKTMILFPQLQEEYKKPLIKAIERISQYQEKDAINQEIAGVSCLQLFANIYSDKKIKVIYESRLKSLLAKQTSEGWFPEYGGADIGYSSVSLHFLTEIWKYSSDKPRIENSVDKLLSFLQYFIHPDGTLGGEYGSRNTEYFLLNGLVSASKFSQTSKRMLCNINWSLDFFDDRYLFHYVFVSYLEGYLNLKKFKLKTATKSVSKSIEHYFPLSGLFIKQDSQIFFISNMKKGGVYKLYSREKLISQNSGYRIALRNFFLTSNTLYQEAVVEREKNSISTLVPLISQKTHVSKPWKHILLRIATIFPFKAELINFLKSRLIFNSSTTDTKFSRKFSFEEKQIKIEDTFSHYLPADALTSKEGSFRYVPSSKFANSISFSLKDKSLKPILTNQKESITIVNY